MRFPPVETLLEPLFFRKALLAGHGTADMFLVDVLFSDVDVAHFSCTSESGMLYGHLR